MTVHCSTCSAEHRAGAAFCHRCGSKVSRVEPAGDAPPSLRTSVHLLWLALGSYFVLLGANLGVLLGRLDLDQLRGFQSVMLVAAVVLLQLASRMGTVPSLRAFVSVPRLRLRLAGELAVGVGAALAAAGLLGLVVPMVDGDLMRLYRTNGDTMRVALLDMCCIAPFLEEIVFRGIVLGALIPLLPGRGALWTSSLMFAALHLTPLTFVHHTLLGYVCGRARLEMKSMLVPVLIHAGYNAVVVLVTW